jgi:hypothetical protein
MRFNIFDDFGRPSDRELIEYITEVIQTALLFNKDPNEVPGTFLKRYCSGSTILRYLQSKHLQCRIK